MGDSNCMNDHDRIVRLETRREDAAEALVVAKEATDKAVEMAASLILKEHELFKNTTEKHFDSVNSLQNRLDKQAEKFITKDDLIQAKESLARETNILSKVVYSTAAALALIQLYVLFHIWKVSP